MTASECSVVVGDQRALAGGVDEPVVPHSGGEGKQALSDPDDDAEAGAAAVLFEAELALEGVVDGLDVLADPGQLAVAPPFFAPVRPYEGRTELADEVLELATGIALVGQDEQPWPQRQVLEH